MDITVIQTGYNRPQNLAPQLAAIKCQTVPAKDFMLWYNQGTKPQVELPGVKIAKCNFNSKFHGRFAMALLAQTTYVAIFDDDTIPGKRWFENCLATMKTHEGILGTLGIILKSNKYRGCSRAGWNGARVAKPIEVDLVGHCWFMKREWLQYLWYEEPISWENGEDIQLSYLAQKYGGIKTFVPPHPPGELDMWGSTKGMKLGADREAHYRKYKEAHYLERDRCVAQAIKQGWKPMYTRRG